MRHSTPCPYCSQPVPNGDAGLHRHYGAKKSCWDANNEEARLSYLRREQEREREVAYQVEFDIELQDVPIYEPRASSNPPSFDEDVEADQMDINDDQIVDDDDLMDVDNGWMDVDDGRMDVDDGDDGDDDDEGNQNEQIPLVTDESEDEPLDEDQPEIHGFASIESHPRGDWVLRWEELEPPGTVEDGTDFEKMVWESETFILAEWLANMTCTDRQRQQYFEMALHEGNLPWASLSEMYKAIDLFAVTPRWKHDTLKISYDNHHEILDVYMRSPVEIVEHILSRPWLRKHTRYNAEKHYTVTLDGRRIRVFGEAWSGEWWWNTQGLLPPGGTLVPFIVGTDPTPLTVIAGDKMAWPVYGTIGNVAKSVRARPSERAVVLIGYLPVPKLEFIPDEEVRRQKRWEIYHAAMAMILEPLKKAGEEGVVMRCADGGVRRIHPILAAKIADWPELCTGACTQATRCPTCTVSFKFRGSWGRNAPLRTKMQTMQVLTDSRRALGGYHAERKRLGLRPTWPYWAMLPFANGGSAAVPDLLHQVHKGLFKTHIFAWWQKLIGKTTLDNRYKTLPRHHGLKHFEVGLSIIQQWTGNEAREVERTFLPVVASSTLTRAVTATSSMMDVFFRLRLPQVDEDDLGAINEGLERFHHYKRVFVDHGAFTNRWGWNGVPKLHMASHWTHQIRQLGTPDGYDTEITERLHRHAVKNPYHQTSKVNAIPQMILRLQRKETWAEARAKFVRAGLVPEIKLRDRQEDGGEDSISDDERDVADTEGAENDQAPGTNLVNGGYHKDRLVHRLSPRLNIASRPTYYKIPGSEIMRLHGAPGFMDALHEYLDTLDPVLRYQVTENSFFALWHRFKLHQPKLPFAPLLKPRVETIRANPARTDDNGRVIRKPYFDCVLFDTKSCHIGISGYQPARIRAVFQLPTYVRKEYPQHLAYLELFNPFGASEAVSGLVKTQQSLSCGNRINAVVPLDDVRMACHLTPKYSSLPPNTSFTATSDLLLLNSKFYLNRHSSLYFWSVMEHWRRVLHFGA
ncbi:Leucine--tRNA ligase [Rhizoctonia solani]|uniref:Leucine--tRNA ligase n=1 Tax=Rhizoctonia solani TaxID=456999 RepID=A0A0K6G9S2_9AGAM|nr:Leucine--tRNA ligase [Rhizoctonia solani]